MRAASLGMTQPCAGSRSNFHPSPKTGSQRRGMAGGPRLLCWLSAAMQGLSSCSAPLRALKILLSLDKSLVRRADWIVAVTTAVAVHSAWSHPARVLYKLLFWMGKRDAENFPVADIASTNGRINCRKRRIETQISWRP
jgi:hypothetical protein